MFSTPEAKLPQPDTPIAQSASIKATEMGHYCLKFT